MSDVKITWAGNWRKTVGKVAGRKRFEIQGDGEKYDVHHYCGGSHKRIIVSTRAKTMKAAQGAALRYMRGHDE